MGASARPAQRLTAFDWLGIGFAALNGVGFFLVPMMSRPLVASLGTLGAQPSGLSRTVFGGGFAAIFGAATLGCASAAAALGSWPLPRRRLLIAGSFVVGGVGVALYVVGAYSAYFAMVDAIQ